MAAVPYPESIDVEGVPFERWNARREMAGLHALAEDDDVRRFLQLPSDEAALAAVSERFAAHWETHGFGLWAARPRDGIGAGWVGACHPRWHPEFADRVELAWSVTVSLRGRGLVTRAAAAAAQAGFSELGLTEILAFVDPANAPSLAVADRLGMQPAGETHHPGSGDLLRIFTLTAPPQLSA